MHLTYNDCREFCRWLSKKEGCVYRLPTEAEWEYACRAGTTTRYYWGNDAADADNYAWHVDNSNGYYQTGGQKSPNAWGLDEMHGNVTEWCLDNFVSYEGKPQIAPQIKRASLKRNTRGSASSHKTSFLSSSYRVGVTPDSRSYFNGFRIVRELDNPKPASK